MLDSSLTIDISENVVGIRRMKEDESIESRVQQAMRSRVQHFRDLADCGHPSQIWTSTTKTNPGKKFRVCPTECSLTFEGVRRLLEKDLALDTYALDKHKKFVKQLLEKLLSSTEDEDNVSEQIKPEKVKKEKEEQKATDDDEDKIEDSPVMGLLSATSKTHDNAKDKIPTEDMIKKAIWKKATYFRSKSEELTVAGVRQLIEEDLEVEKFSLDPFKKLISKQLDEVLNSQNDTPNKTDDASHSESEEKEVQVKPKKKSAPKTKPQKSEAPKKRKKPAQETDQPKKKKKMKNAEETSAKKKNVKDADEDSSGEKSESSAEKKEVVAPVYGKKVERLKSIIKACGMSVAPTVYRKAKQAPEDKREAILVKELKEILSKEGLSANPSEKEIKEVKRRKEKAKELEGIDTSNIVVGSRRRSTFNFVAPPKPKAAVESDADESSQDSDNEDADADADDQEGDDDKGGDDDDGKNDDKDDEVVDESKSEEVTGNDEMV